MAEAEGRKRGLLLKRSEWLRMWNRRHVILSPATLSWYDGTTQKGSLHLDAWTKVVVDRDRHELSLQWPDAHPNRNVYFRCADGLEELINWRRAFEAAARPEQTGVYRTAAECAPAKSQVLTPAMLSSVDWSALGRTQESAPSGDPSQDNPS